MLAACSRQHLPSPQLRLKELSGGQIVCPYLRLLDRLSSVSLCKTTWLEPPWLSSCITSIYGTHKQTWSSGICFLRYLWVKYGTVSLPIFNTFSCGFNPSRHHYFQLFSYNKVMVLKKVVTKKKCTGTFIKTRVNNLSPFTVGL